MALMKIYWFSPTERRYYIGNLMTQWRSDDWNLHMRWNSNCEHRAYKRFAQSKNPLHILLRLDVVQKQSETWINIDLVDLVHVSFNSLESNSWFYNSIYRLLFIKCNPNNDNKLIKICMFKYLIYRVQKA